jgi:hypothetical protein
MKSMRHALGLTAVLMGLGPLAGCSRAPKAEAPASTSAPAPGLPGSGLAEPETEPKTLAEAEALFERSRVDFDRVAMNAPPPPPPVAAGAAPAQAPAPVPAAPTTESAPKRAEKAAADEASAAPHEKDANGGCETACKAFSSLERASDAVCRLDADGGQRCERARRIRDEARLRVASCGCSK